MRFDKKALKAALVRQYACQLDDILEQIAEDQPLHLTDIEDMALKVRQAVGKDVTEALVVTESEKQAVEVTCPECQQRMRYKGRKKKWLKTRSGDINVERPYYYCPGCRQGHFPPG